MKRYRVLIESRDIYEMFVEADSEDAAWQQADDLMCEGEWGAIVEGAGDVCIYSVSDKGE